MWESAHAIEHMRAAMTSKKYPDAKKMSEQMDLRGISSNATTSRETVRYYMKGLKEHTDWMVNALLATYLQPHFDAKIFKQEMQAIEQELRSDISETWHELDTKMYAILFKGQPISVSTKQKLKNVPNLSIASLRKLEKPWYQPQLVQLYISGDVSRKTLEGAKKALCRRQAGSTEPPKPQLVKRPWGKVFAVPRKEDTKNIGLRIVFPIELEKFDYQKRVAATCLDVLLSGGFSSRLYKLLRKKLGLIYHIKLEVSQSREPRNSYVLIATECSLKNLPKAVENICKVCKDMAKDGPSAYEMRKWRNVVQMDSVDGSLSRDPVQFVDDYEDYLLSKNEFPTNHKLRSIALKLKRKDVKQLAEEVFSKNCLMFHSANKSLDLSLERAMARGLGTPTRTRRSRCKKAK